MKFKNILITGGCGFIGTNFIIYLSKYEDINIKVIDNLWRGTKKYINHLKNVEIIEEDLTNSDICLKYIKNVDIIYLISYLRGN